MKKKKTDYKWIGVDRDPLYLIEGVVLLGIFLLMFLLSKI